jgi:adenine phosphoribosyltransferase
MLDHVRKAIRDIPDFPQPGIIFKDITPVLKEPALFDEVVKLFAERVKALRQNSRDRIPRLHIWGPGGS